jgi:hypothetical protein
MNKKIESIYQNTTSSSSDLKVIKKGRKNLLFPKNIETISVENNPHDIKTVQDVFSQYGKFAALSARFGSFDNFRRKNHLPETGTVSLFTYFFAEDSKVLTILIPDHSIERIAVSSRFSIEGKCIRVKKSEIYRLIETEPVQIGKGPDSAPFIQIVRFPLTVLKVDCEETEDQNLKSLNEIIFNNLSSYYGETTVSGIFTQSVVSKKPLLTAQGISSEGILKSLLK